MANKYGLDLDAAWRRVLAEVAHDDVPDVLEWQDFKLLWSEWKKEIESELDAGTYKPSDPGFVELPKDALLNRPLTLLRPKDRVVYEAIIDVLIPAIEGVLPDRVFSARVVEGKTGRRRMKNPVREWVRFAHAGRDHYKANPDVYMLSTDVTSYFEYVDVKILCRDLLDLPDVDASVVELLQGFLMELVRCTERGGIPQGPTASSILGNFYLLPVDQKFADAGLEFFRYQDDIKIFADSSQNLRHLLTHILRLLRARRLSLSVHKTKLLHGDKILAEFEDAEKDAISYGLKIKSPVVKDRLRAFFDKAVSQPTISARDVRFAITRLSDLNDPHAVSWILGHLSEVPYLAAQLVEYLGGWVDSTPEIEKNTREFLEDPFDNIYPFTELHLIRMLCRATSLSTQTMSTIWRVLSDKNKENFVREHAARCIGRHPRAGDVARLRNELAYATDDRIRRALLVAICEAAPIDKAWLGSIAVTHPKLRATCAFLGTGAKIPAP